MDNQLLSEYGLQRLAGLLERYAQPAVGFSLAGSETSLPPGASKLGGNPDLPTAAEWPVDRDRPLDFLLQVNLSEAAPLDRTGLLPAAGLLSFFYDLENEPWGYDPQDLGGFRVLYIPAAEAVVPRDVPNEEYRLPEYALSFHPTTTLPHPRSRATEQLRQEAQFSEDEWDSYWSYVDGFETQFYPEESGNHHMLGHSANIQGDMQLEAQLVTHGLYCGDTSGYEDPRACELESGAGDWLLLLQLDSDDPADLMWGDEGMLYFWIRREDLQQRRFDKVWMSLQCY